MDKGVAAASEGHVADAARDALTSGNAIDGLVAGIGAAAAESASVLLGSVQILVGGAGTGLLAFDGRPRQPGRGAPRPRGFLPDEPVPDTARVAAPMLPATIATVIASIGSMSLSRALRPAIATARVRSPERASVLEALVRRGVPAIAEGAIAAELVAAAGRATRGLLTLEDLAAMRPEVERLENRARQPGGGIMVPWLEDAGADPVARDATTTQVVATADGRGMVAIACYETPVDGVPVPALGLVAPKAAAPVMRGKTRVAVGEARPAAAPIALRMAEGSIDLAIGIALQSDAESIVRQALVALESYPNVTEALAAVRGGRRVALLRGAKGPRVVTSE